MIVVAAITLSLVLVALGAFIYGTVQLSKFAFRISTGRGIAAIFFPPYTFYFAFAELEEEDKAIPTASWVFGLVVSVLLTVLFFQPMQLLLSGQFDKLATNPGDAARSEYASAGADAGTATSDDAGTASTDQDSDEDSADAADDAGASESDASSSDADVGVDADGS